MGGVSCTIVEQISNLSKAMAEKASQTWVDRLTVDLQRLGALFGDTLTSRERCKFDGSNRRSTSSHSMDRLDRSVDRFDKEQLCIDGTSTRTSSRDARARTPSPDKSLSGMSNADC